MADNFGLKIGVEGEKEFKKVLADINQSFKVLGSEMKLVSSQFDKNDKSVQAQCSCCNYCSAVGSSCPGRLPVPDLWTTEMLFQTLLLGKLKRI